jgi:DNA primase
MDTVSQIKERLSINEVISSYITVQESGKNYKARCPFHNEKTPSFHISPGRGSYYCFGCGAKGDIFTFVQEFEGLDFKGALKVLADRAGVTIVHSKKDSGEFDRLFLLLDTAVSFFQKELDTQHEAKEYILSRGVSLESIAEFRIGFAPNDWRSLLTHLNEKGYTNKEIELAGLIKESGGKTYDRFRGRIMFPIFDTSGRPIAFSGRILPSLEGEGDKKSAKYINSPDTPLYHKSHVLYGLHLAKSAIRKNTFSILVEGQLDLILSHQSGFKNTVAASGTALVEKTERDDESLNHLGILYRLSPNIVLALDRDEAGIKAMMRSAHIMLTLGMEVKVADIPEGLDPADCISKNGVESWKQAIRSGEHVILFFTKRAMIESDKRKQASLIKETVLPLILRLPSALDQEVFVDMVANESGLSKDALLTDLRSLRVKTKEENKDIISEVSPKVILREGGYLDSLKRQLAGAMLLLESRKESEAEKKLHQIIEDTFDEKTKNEIAYLGKKDAEELIFNQEALFNQSPSAYNDHLTELLTRLEEQSVRIEIDLIGTKLKKAELDHDSDSAHKLLLLYQTKQNVLHSIKTKKYSIISYK